MIDISTLYNRYDQCWSNVNNTVVESQCYHIIMIAINYIIKFLVHQKFY